MKPLRFLGNSLEGLREFPEDVRHDAGYQLEQVQRGKPARDFKPMPSVGREWKNSGCRMILVRIV